MRRQKAPHRTGRVPAVWPAAVLAVLLAFSPPGPGKQARAEARDAAAAAPEMWIEVSGEEVLPGQAVIVSFCAPEGGVYSIRLTDREGRSVSAVAEERTAVRGYNALYWNGTWMGEPAPEGEWILVLEMNGRRAETPVTVGRTIPFLIAPVPDAEQVLPGRRVTVSFWATEAGEVTLTLGEGTDRIERREHAEKGENSLSFEAAVAPGTYQAEMTLRREDGTVSNRAGFSLTVVSREGAFTPLGKAREGEDSDYTLNGWTVPMEIQDEDAVWQALTAPVTVLDDGKEKAQVRQTVIRKEPDGNSEGVGTVTLASQGVHVLERGGEWTKIECYSSSFHDSPILNWNVLVQGWVETKYLRTVIPNQEMGLVVDKLTQRLYIFRDGALYSTLLVSTGLANERQPYNETRSGEFLLVSKVGGFYSDNLFCPRALRFNDGDLLHEVPYREKDGLIDYSMTETKLGTRASHGCIRVQRKANPDGVNQAWLYENYRANTKILIWEDWQGRQIPVPEADEIFWVNPQRNDYYHGSPACKLAGTRSVQEITYAELSAEDSKWKACPACGPVMKESRLQEINALYAPGGDHDPVLTEARTDCPKKRGR